MLSRASHYPEGAFSNPNAFMAESTLEWLCECSRTVVRESLLGAAGAGTGAGVGAGASEEAGEETGGAAAGFFCGGGTGVGRKDRDEDGVLGGRGGGGERASGASSGPPLLQMTNLPSLLELYCGNGNHTVALSAMYRRVAAVVGRGRLRLIEPHI